MAFNNTAKELFDDVPIPEKLLPVNIALMLQESTKNKNNNIKHDNQRSNDNKPVVKTGKVISHKNNTTKIKLVTRTMSTIAAAVVLIVGITAFLKNDDSQKIPTIKNPDLNFDTELVSPTDYTELFDTFQKVYAESSKTHYTSGDFFTGLPAAKNDSSMALESSSSVPKPVTKQEQQVAVDTNVASSQTGTSSSFSETHEQVNGVAEADIIKTDGTNIFYIANGNLYIVKSDKGKMTLLSKVSTENIFPRDMFILGTKLILISDKFEPVKNSDTPQAKSYVNSPFNDSSSTVSKDIMIDYCMPQIGINNLQVDIYDISNVALPTLVNTYSQNGNYVSSRMIGNNLYAVTNQSNNQTITLTDKTDLEKYVPTYSLNNTKCFIAPQDINIPKTIDNTSFTIIAGLDVTAKSPLVSVKAILGYSGTVYSSMDSIYVAGQKWSDNSQTTVIARFSIDNGKLTHTGFGKVDGVILNQFSMDEYNGYFRVATTDYNYKKEEQTNGVYILDKNLTVIGSLTGIAKTETIKSVRYDKDICYLVTFRQTDPLFKIDLTDPKKPKILSEEKVNGYSTYLISYGKDKLLGFGVDADKNGTQTGLKLSMFNTTDGEDVSEITSISLGDDLQAAWSPALNDHKSLLIDAEKNIIGIPVSFYDGIDQCDRYYLVTYTDAGGFKIIGNVETHNIDGIYQFTRGMYIGDVVYAFSQGRIVSAKISDMTKISALDLVAPTKVPAQHPEYVITDDNIFPEVTIDLETNPGKTVTSNSSSSSVSDSSKAPSVTTKPAESTTATTTSK